MTSPARVLPRTRLPLGSLTQPGTLAGVACHICGSARVTRIAMNLTDGSSVDFTSCHECETRSWTEPGGTPLSVDRVLDRTRKV